MFPIAKAQPKSGLSRLPLRQSSSEKSQAISELAIFGALILVAFAAVLTYIQSMNAQQSYQMKAFRRALAESRSQNKVISYTIVKDSPVFDIRDLFGRPDTSRQVASGTVFALRKDPLFPDLEDEDDRDSAEYYEINGQSQEVRPIKIKLTYDDGNDYETWIAAPIRDVEYSTQKTRQGQIAKTENRSSISTTRSGSATAQQDTTTLILQDQEAFRADYLADANDVVEQEPWEKRIKIENLSYTLANWIAFIGVIFITGLLCDQPISDCAPCQSCYTIKSVILGAISAILSALFSYFLGNDVPSGTVEDVEIVDGYPASGTYTFTETGSFSIPAETFSVPH